MPAGKFVDKNGNQFVLQVKMTILIEEIFKMAIFNIK